MLYIILIAVAFIVTSALLLHAKKQYNDLKDEFAALNSGRIVTEHLLGEANAELERAKGELENIQKTNKNLFETVHVLEEDKKFLMAENETLKARLRTDAETAEAAIQSLKAKYNAALASKHVDVETASKDAEAAQKELDKTDAAIEKLRNEDRHIRAILSPPEVPGTVGGAIAVVGLDEDGHVLGAGWIKSLKQDWNQAFEEIGRHIDARHYGDVPRFLILTDHRIGNLLYECPNWRQVFCAMLNKSKIGSCTVIAAWKVEEQFKKRREDIAAETEALYKARNILEKEFTNHVTSMIA